MNLPLTQILFPLLILLQVLVLTECSHAGALASSTAAGEVQLIEGRLSWLVHIIGAIIQGRMSSNLGESQVRPATVSAGSSWAAWQCCGFPSWGPVWVGASACKLAQIQNVLLWVTCQSAIPSGRGAGRGCSALSYGLLLGVQPLGLTCVSNLLLMLLHPLLGLGRALSCSFTSSSLLKSPLEQ